MVSRIQNKIVSFVLPYVKIPTVGVDISDRSVKFLKLRSARLLDLDFYGQFAVPQGVIENGEVIKESELASVVRQWLEKDGRRVRGSYAVLSLPEERSFLRVIQVPKMDKEKLGNAIRWEIEANIPLAPDDLIYDYEVIEPLEDHLEHLDVVITAFPKEIVEAYVRAFTNGGVELYALELESQAIARAAVRQIREKKARIIVDMGRTRTSFIIFASGAIIFTRTIELGGALLEENIAKSMGVGPDEAAKLKKDFGLDKTAESGEVFKALVPAVSALSEELKSAVEYYQNHASHVHGADKAIDEILLSGGDANLNGLATYISSALRVPVRMADPWAGVGSGFSEMVPPIRQNEALAYMVAIGLALRGR